MVAVYLLLTAALVMAAMTVGSRRAAGLMVAGGPRLHSLPSYHGFQAAIVVFVVMLAILAVGVVIERQVTTAATLSAFSAEVAADPLRRGAALREAASLADGSYRGEPSPELRAAASTFSTARAASGWLMIALGLAGGAAALLFSLRTVSTDHRARNGVERFVNISTDKAADASSVLGRTKRVAEQLRQRLVGDRRQTLHGVAPDGVERVLPQMQVEEHEQ